MAEPKNVSQSTPPPQPDETFSSVLEADHLDINRMAKRLRDRLIAEYASSTSQSQPSAPTPSTPDSDPETLRIRDEVVWRLIRHDISEELVMRPAYVEYLGDDGRAMVEGDRKDHEDARTALLTLLSTPFSDLIYFTLITKTLVDLAQHMKRESGTEIPRLEAALPLDRSRRLAKRYRFVQRIVMPDARWPVGRERAGEEGKGKGNRKAQGVSVSASASASASDSASRSEKEEGEESERDRAEEGEKVFKDLDDYVRAGANRFHEIVKAWEEVEPAPSDRAHEESSIGTAAATAADGGREVTSSKERRKSASTTSNSRL